MDTKLPKRNENTIKGSMSVSEAGKKGGQRTASSHGHEFYRTIGHKGGEIGGRRVKELIEEGKKRKSEAFKDKNL